MPPFADIKQLSDQNRQDARTRAFTGDGSKFLPVPGLLKYPERVQCRASDRTVDLQYRFEDHVHEGGQPVLISQAGFFLAHDNDRPVLLRHERSNNGIWQKGVVFLVTGEWEARLTPDPDARVKKLAT